MCKRFLIILLGYLSFYSWGGDFEFSVGGGINTVRS